MAELLNGIVNILQNGSVEAKIGVISGLLAIAGAIGWVAKVTVGRLILSAEPAPVAPGGVVITEELLDEIIQKRVREALARDAGPSGESGGDTAGLIRDAEAGLEDVAREGADGAAAVERFIETGETGRAKAMLRELAQQDAAEGAKVNAKAAERYRRLGALAFLDSTQEAMDAYARATELDPDDPEGWSRLGALQLRTGALDAAIDSFERVLSIVNTLTDKSIQARATVFLGWINFTKGNMATAEQLSEQAVELAKAASDQKQEMRALGNLAVIYRTRGDLEKAEKTHQRELDLAEKLEDKEGQARATGNLGLIYEMRGELDRAEAMFKRQLELAEELGIKEQQAAATGNLGLIYRARGELDRAEAMHKRALELAEELGHKEYQAAATGNLGLIYRTRGELDRAEAMYLRSLEISDANGMKELSANQNGNLGSVYQQQGDTARLPALGAGARSIC